MSENFRTVSPINWVMVIYENSLESAEISRFL